jgi:type II secretion system protein J
VDAPAGDQGREAVLMEGVEAATVQYLGPDGRGRDRWPPPAGGDAEVPALPRAVEVTLRFQGRGTFKRVFHVGAPR